tara:strand:+ start:55423 stop:56019 length:597 start_codon:yes stop_codon:yes gene_type:complete
MKSGNTDQITRKDAIKRTGYILGGVIFAPNIIGLLNGCTPNRNVDWKPVLFNEYEAKLVTSLADIIMPKDDYPSASEVGVPSFIESMVTQVYNDEQRDIFLMGLNKFGSFAKETLQTDFSDSLDEDRYRFTYEQNKAALKMRSDSENASPFFLMFKELTILGYFTSESGATQTLRYEPVPGYYSGCMPFSEVGKTWAT